MIGRFLKLLGAIFVALFTIITPIVITYYINRSTPNVRYTLSEEIPITFSSPGTPNLENVQQLEVKNIGNAQADNIVVKIDDQLADYFIEKYSSADNVQAFDNQRPFEVNYDNLPPQAGFIVVFKPSGEGVTISDIEISHDSGPAQAALASTGTDPTRTVLSLAYFFGALIFIVLSVRLIRRDYKSIWKSSKSTRSVQQIMEEEKPWYVFDSEWPQLQYEVIKSKITIERFWRDSIQKSDSFQFLTIENTPTDGDYQELQDFAIERLERAIASEINSAIYRDDRIMEVLRLEKPSFFPSSKWDNLTKKANEQYVVLMKRERYYSIEDIRGILNETKPNEVTQAAWDEITEFWQKKYAVELLYELMTSSSPIDYAQNSDTSLLAEHDDTILKRRALLINNYNKQKEKVDQLAESFDNLLKGVPLLERPNRIDDLEWRKLKRKEDSLAQLRGIDSQKRELEKLEHELSSTKMKIDQKKESLDRRLRFIHDLLNDPTVIDRVEDPDDTFASGNWENLRILSQYLKEMQNN